MKKFITIIALTISTQFSFGQIVASSCTAPDSIVEKYNADADRLTVRKIYQYNLTYIDSIEIPQTHTDTILNAMIAVYNATSLPARDTVITMYNIHSFPNPDINSFSVSADSNLTWMQQLKNGIFPTGNSTIDSLTNLYNLNVTYYSTYFGFMAYHTVSFQSDSNYNIQPLSDIYETISGVFFSDPGGWGGDGNDITSTIYSDHVELIYSVGWEDCPSGCIARRYWKFKIYYDCSVEFVGSYGTPLAIATINELDRTFSTAVFPNPFDNHFAIKGLNEDYDYFIYNMAGQLMTEGKSFKGQTQNLDFLPLGQYLLRVKTNKQITIYKLVKN